MTGDCDDCVYADGRCEDGCHLERQAGHAVAVRRAYLCSETGLLCSSCTVACEAFVMGSPPVRPSE